jgi:hypothetical protein
VGSVFGPVRFFKENNTAGAYYNVVGYENECGNILLHYRLFVLSKTSVVDGVAE